MEADGPIISSTDVSVGIDAMEEQQSMKLQGSHSTAKNTQSSSAPPSPANVGETFGLVAIFGRLLKTLA